MRQERVIGADQLGHNEKRGLLGAVARRARGRRPRLHPACINNALAV